VKALQAACVALCCIGIATAGAAAYVPYEAREKQRHLERVFERGVENGDIETPWKSSDLQVAGKLSYPRLRESAVILTSATEKALRAAPSLVPGTANIGEAGTSVIVAHRETHFAFLRSAKVGDVIKAAGRDGVEREYRVSRLQIVDADDFVVPVGISDNRLALMTCFPFNFTGISKRRFVAHAELVE
jgi:sortase A